MRIAPHFFDKPKARRRTSGLTLTEVVISTAMAAVTVGAVIACYLMAAQRSEWTTASTAAHQLAGDRMAQLRAARWELAWEGEPGRNELVPQGPTWDPPMPLAVPNTGGNELWATNLVTITNIGVDRPLMLLRVDCVWSLPLRGPFTNTLISYRSPD